MSKKKAAAFRDLTDRKDVIFHGPGSFEIGLSADGSVIVEPECNSEGVCVLLLDLTASPSGGYVLAPANKDLPCVINESEELTGEINLIDGTRLEVANKTLVFIDGPIPVRRRKLPRTPGMPLEDDGPPSKPSRAQTTEKDQAIVTDKDSVKKTLNNHHTVHPDNPEDSDESSDAEEEDKDKRWLETSWCKMDMPTAEQQLFVDLNTPEQISIVSASYFCKQLRVFTDANFTMKLLDDVFKLFKDSVIISKDIFLDYLSEISKMIQKNPRRSQTRPMHGPAIKLLNGLLKQSLEPLSRVILLLDLVRTFSHFDSNMVTMARHQVGATVLGCMSVYCDVVEVQSFGLDTLAKIAKFKPAIDKKAPIREGAVQIVLKTEKQHHKNLTICRSLCRVLANLAASIIDVTNSLLDAEVASNTSVTEAVEKYEGLLLFMFKQSVPVVQTILDDHGTDLGVKTEGRRFVYYYAKLPQLQQKKKIWLQSVQQEEEEIEVEMEAVHNTSAPPIQDLIAYKEEETEPRSILKRVGSFENLRDPNKKIMFADNTVGGSDSDSSSDDENIFTGPFPEPKIPTQIEMEEDFSFHLMQTFIGKTIGKKKHRSRDSSDSSDSSDEDDFIARSPVKSFAQKVNAEQDNEINENTSRLKLVSDNANTQDQYNTENNNMDSSLIKSENTNNAINKTDIVTFHTDTNSPSSVENTECENERVKTLAAAVHHEKETIPTDKSETKTLCCENDLGPRGLKKIRNMSKSQQEPNVQCDPSDSMDSNELPSASNNKVFTNGKETSISQGWDLIDNAELSGMDQETKEQTDIAAKTLASDKDEKKSVSKSALNSEHEIQAEVKSELKRPAQSDKTKDTHVADIPFMGKLVKTQIISHIGSLVFQGDDSKVLLVIDQPITELLEHAAAPAGVIEFARNQYGKAMTLMDLEPSIVISAIDAVRYRSVTAELVQKAVLSLTRAISHELQPSTVDNTMLFYKALFADDNLKSVITDKQFVKDFKLCFGNATGRLQRSHSIEEIREKLKSPSFIV